MSRPKKLEQNELETAPQMLRHWIASEGGGPVGVVGGGVVGSSATKLLSAAGFSPIVISERKLSVEEKEELESEGAEVRDGIVPAELSSAKWLPTLRFVLISPGYSLAGGLARAFTDAFVYPVNELDLYLAFAGRPDVAISGSAGKSTSTALVAEMLQASGRRTDIVGHAGQPILDLLDPDAVRYGEPMPPDDRSVVMEVSPSQLEWSRFFAPRISVWLNAKELLDEQAASQQLQAYARLFKAQERATDWSILNQDDPSFAALLSHVNTRLMPFRKLGNDELFQKSGSYFSAMENAIRFRHEGWSEKFSLDRFALIGEHNKLNLAASVAAALLAGSNREAIAEAITTFRPLEHRLEYIREVRGVKYINDSKATSVHAASASVKAIREEYRSSSLVVLVGGQAKHESWKPLADEIANGGISSVIAFGQDGALVSKSIGAELKSDVADSLRLSVVKTLENAVYSADECSQPGGVVLLAPGCVSFDAFSNFAERGRHFKELVNSL